MVDANYDFLHYKFTVSLHIFGVGFSDWFCGLDTLEIQLDVTLARILNIYCNFFFIRNVATYVV